MVGLDGDEKGVGYRGKRNREESINLVRLDISPTTYTVGDTVPRRSTSPLLEDVSCVGSPLRGTQHIRLPPLTFLTGLQPLL